MRNELMRVSHENRARLILAAWVLAVAAMIACDMEPPRGNVYDPANDPEGPRVVSTVPGSGDAGVPVSQVISASFSEAINELSVDHTSFAVVDRNGDYVYGKITCDGATIIFEPHVAMDSAQTYTVVITTAVTDNALNPMVSRYEWSFRTAHQFTPDMVPVAGGTYMRGNNDIAGIDTTAAEYLNGPAHEVVVSSFDIGRYEVTVEEYAEYCRSTGIPTPAAPFGGGKMPVVYVSWYDAVKYCNWLSDIMGYDQCYSTDDNINYECNFAANGYRLPTAAEWEFAARYNPAQGAVMSGEQFSGHVDGGSESIDAYVVYRSNSRGGTEFVDDKAPNCLGLHHMSGNVREWCWDFNEFWIWNYDINSGGQLNELEGKHYYIHCSDAGSVSNPAGYTRVSYSPMHNILRKTYWPLAFSMRGGGWSDGLGDDYTPASPLLTAVRSDSNHSTMDLPTRRRDNLGFRLCRTHVE